jgi:HlyD family secretion protein
MKKRLRIIIPMVLVVVVGLYLFNYLKNREDANALRFSGNIEVTEAQMSFRTPGRLAERLVDEGDKVHAGQVLARLDKSDQSIAVAQAEANLAYAEAVLAELLAGSRTEDIDRAVAEQASAKAAEQSAIVQLNQAKTDFDRYTSLFKDGSVSKTVLETYQTGLKTAENRVKEAEARTKATSEGLSLLKAGSRKESIDQAKAKVQVALEGVNQARQQLAYTELVAPMDGVVLSTAAEAGEYLNPASPVLTLGQIAKPWLRAYIHEKDLGRIQLNQEVKVHTDSFPDKSYAGRVSYISSQAEFTPKTVQTFEERVKLMYRIKVTLANPENELKPGMPADGRIDLSGR